jgi:hypothetical protein
VYRTDSTRWDRKPVAKGVDSCGISSLFILMLETEDAYKSGPRWLLILDQKRLVQEHGLIQGVALYWLESCVANDLPELLFGGCVELAGR